MMNDQTIKTLIETYHAQLGEIAWHSVSVDSDPDTVGDEHSRFMEDLVAKHDLLPRGRPLRFLEVSPYLHTTGQWLNHRFGADSAACDISPHSLRVGQMMFERRHGPAKATLVAGDFHDLPFSTDYFDIVFIASAVHHTLRPERVLAELVRVARPGGMVVLYNEPVGSTACFYAFRSNRIGELTPWEQRIADADLTRIISSPFPGSRPEQLFGMTENDRIPLDVYLDVAADIVTLELTPLPSELDRSFVETRASAEAISTEIDRRLEDARSSMARREVLMGFALPAQEEVREFSQAYADAIVELERIRQRSSQERGKSIGTMLRSVQETVLSSRLGRRLGLASLPEDRPSAVTQAETRLFGASLRMVLRKRGNGSPSQSMLAADLQQGDGVYLSSAMREGLRIRLGESTLPSISSDMASDLARHFPVAQWSLLDQGSTFAQCLNGSSGEITLAPRADQRQVLLLRYYAVAHDAGPYWVELQAEDGGLLDVSPICASESRLLKVLLPPGCGSVRLVLRGDEDQAMAFSLHLRIAFVDVIGIESVAS